MATTAEHGPLQVLHPCLAHTVFGRLVLRDGQCIYFQSLILMVGTTAHYRYSVARRMVLAGWCSRSQLSDPPGLLRLGFNGPRLGVMGGET